MHVSPALAADASAEASTSTLEEVVVTARKRTENLQDVPISIDVFTPRTCRISRSRNSKTTRP